MDSFVSALLEFTRDIFPNNFSSKLIGEERGGRSRGNRSIDRGERHLKKIELTEEKGGDKRRAQVEARD